MMDRVEGSSPSPILLLFFFLFLLPFPELPELSLSPETSATSRRRPAKPGRRTGSVRTPAVPSLFLGR